ncbi:MAG: ABC transporter substrate-binding protein [Treponema sp.]|jgi:peptide/nickel transport system substrate-binding protein|nr:ABC transporter substrate-binding protein [Treponema sp.]
MKKTVIYFLLAVMALSIFPSCTRKNADNSQLRYGFASEPTTLDPLSSDNTADGRSILFNVFEGLVKPGIDGTMLPCIASSWTVEQSGLSYNFTIREGVLFHDGSVVTPADIKFSLDTAIASGFPGLDNISEVTIQGENQIRILLKSIDPEFLPYLTIGIVKREIADRKKDVIGTGPFFVESYTKQSNLVLKKFDNYRQDGLPHLEKVTIVFFSNYDALLVAFRGGSIDGASITGAMAEQLSHRQFDIFNNSSSAVQLLALNNASPPFNDIRVRRAINFAVNIQEIIDAAFFGVGEPSGSPIIPGLSVYYENSYSTGESQYNPDMARTLLSQAGFNERNKLIFEITVPSNYAMHIDTAQVIVDQLEKIDVDATIKLVDWSTWLSEVYFGRQYQATIISLDSPTVSPRSFLTRYQSDNVSNFINFNSADFDRIYNAVLTETNNERRIALYKEAQRVIIANSASVYIQDILYFTALRQGAYDGVVNYPLYVTDFAAIYGKKE